MCRPRRGSPWPGADFAFGDEISSGGARLSVRPLPQHAELPDKDFRRGQPRFSEENFAANLRLVDRLRELAAAHSATPAQLALAWLLHHGEDVVPLVGCTRVPDLEENLAAIDISFGSAELAVLADALPDAVGERYDAAGMRTVGL
jgi:aryl-alcohol dehydrogenase-like predicted oxidoreductase